MIRLRQRAYKEKIEFIRYEPRLQDTGDLEPATSTITATSKPATPNYTASETIPDVPDDRLVVTTIGMRGGIRIDSFGGTPTATKLYCTVEVGGTEVISAVELTSAPADNLFGADLTTTQFPLGSAQSIGIFLWVDQGEAVVSHVQMWVGVGNYGTDWKEVLRIKHSGFLLIGDNSLVRGSGTLSRSLMNSDVYSGSEIIRSSDVALYMKDCLILCADQIIYRLKSSASSDLSYIYAIIVVLRSEQ